MALVDRLFDNVESFFAWLGILLKQSQDSYCELETADSRYALVTKNSSLISIIKIEGLQRFVGNAEFDEICKRFASSLQSVFSSPGHFVQFYYDFNPEEIHEHINRSLKNAEESAKRLCLDIEDLFVSKKNVLSEVCAEESCYLVLWTEPSALSDKYVKKLLKENAKKVKDSPLPISKKSANLFLGLDELRNLHDSLVGNLMEDLQQIGMYAHLLDVHTAVQEVRRSIDPKITSYDWKPSLPGDPLPLSLDQFEGEVKEDSQKKNIKHYDLSELMWPPLSSQVNPREGENVDIKVARVGDMIYAPLYIDLFPKDIRPFYDLFRRAVFANLPWRLSFYISDNGLKITQAKNWLAQYLTFSSFHNKLIVETHRYLRHLHERGDDPIVKLKVMLLTWAPVGETTLLKKRAVKLTQLVQAWGGCEVKEFYGDPYSEVMSSALAMRNTSDATTSAAPLSDVVKMLPITRPASPWKKGALLFRTPDGKLWPYQPGSNHQISWIDIIYARSGSGKSVLLNCINLGLCLSPGLAQLPRISIIDIGPSSCGFISLLKESLPADKKNKVVYHRLKLEKEHAINPFDTQLGARQPTKLHRSFLINFLSLLYVERADDALPEGMSGMLSLLIDELYQQFSDQVQPKPYIPDFDEVIHKNIEKYEIKFNEKTSWWNIVDKFHKLGQSELALRAQRYAMPTLADTISIVHNHGIKDIYAKVCLPGSNEDYVSAYCRSISVIIRNYPTLSTATQLSLESARVIALDLEDVARSGSPAADKQTAVMYMLSRHAIAQNFFLRQDDLVIFPKEYQRYHEQRIREILEEPKRIVYDEFHRTANSLSVRQQVIQDMREGRKWKIQISLASQALSDFDKIMIDFATGIFILDSGSSQSIDETCKTFGLNKTERYALANRVHGPKSSGATFIAQFVTKQGLNTQLLTSTVSPVELWAFNTTAEDVYLRESLYKILGPEEARKRLAKAYPRGSAVKEVETLVSENSDLTVTAACEQILEKLLK
ncbi:AAA family ATPase [Piscirickettsia salmonis]|uniref:AAA family ATPase n=1 Tax=Piscirickettsia salmonis TaxID=1238 RepID=UPI003EBF31D5